MESTWRATPPHSTTHPPRACVRRSIRRHIIALNVIKRTTFGRLPGLLDVIEYRFFINHESICQQRNSGNTSLGGIL